MEQENINIRIAVLIVAGGSGTRMGNRLPKQFISLAGKPVIVRSVETFRDVLPGAGIYIALGQETEKLWKYTAREYGLEGACRLCRGGETRFETVKNSLSVIEPCEMVLIHDAVRPLVSRQVIDNVIETTRQHGTAVPVIPIVDSLRISGPDGTSEPFDRDRLKAVQTPQGFRYDLLRDAYRQDYKEEFTDDARVVESAGHRVALCEGMRNNIKLTYPEDMILAEAIITARDTKGF